MKAHGLVESETVGTEGARSDRALLGTLLASGAVQISMVLSAAVTLPLLTRALSAAEYGVYATLTGFVALLAFADLGIGAALTNTLAVEVARGNVARARVLVATAVVGSLIAALAVFAVATSLIAFVDLRALFGARHLDPAALRLAFAAMAVSVAIGIVGTLGQRVLYGLQQGARANRMVIFATVCSTIAVIIISQSSAPLYVFVLVGLGVPGLASLVMTVWVLSDERNPAVVPDFHGVTRHQLVALARPSRWYLVIAVAAAAGYQTDVLVVAAVLGAPSAGIYSVCSRVFSLVVQFIYPALVQLTPAFSAALARGDRAWIRSRLRLSMVGSATFSILFGVVMISAGQELIRLWLGPDLVPSTGLLIAAAAWTCYSITTAPVYFWLQAMGRARAHALMSTAVAIANVPLSISFTHTVGISGPMWGSLVATSLFAGVPALALLISETCTRKSAHAPPRMAP